MKRLAITATLILFGVTGRADAFIFTDTAALAQRASQFIQTAAHYKTFLTYKDEFDKYKLEFEKYFKNFRQIYRGSLRGIGRTLPLRTGHGCEITSLESGRPLTRRLMTLRCCRSPPAQSTPLTRIQDLCR